MASNSIALVAGGLVVVALSFGAGILGASFGTQTDGPRDDAGAAVSDPATRARVSELDRRLENIEERMRVVEDTANSALERAQQIDGLRRDIEALKAGGVVRAPEVAPPEGPGIGLGKPPPVLTTEARAQRDRDRMEEVRASMRRIANRNGPLLLKHRLARIAAAGDQGDADRRSQMFADSKIMATQYGLTPAEEQTVREILEEEMAAAVREIAPFLAAGIEKADYSQVKPKLGAIWDRRDNRMSEVLDEQQFEAYTETQQEWRKIFDGTLDDMERKRLGQD